MNFKLFEQFTDTTQKVHMDSLQSYAKKTSYDDMLKTIHRACKGRYIEFFHNGVFKTIKSNDKIPVYFKTHINDVNGNFSWTTIFVDENGKEYISDDDKEINFILKPPVRKITPEDPFGEEVW